MSVYTVKICFLSNRLPESVRYPEFSKIKQNIPGKAKMYLFINSFYQKFRAVKKE